MRTSDILRSRVLRKEGKSIREIATALNASSSSVSHWVRDVKLTQAQIAVLEGRRIKNNSWFAGVGRVQAERNRTESQERKNNFRNLGRRLAESSLNFSILCALYWGDGAKRENSFILSNSDPKMILLVCRVIEELGFSDNIGIEVRLNSSVSNRIDEMKKYWEKITQNKYPVKVYLYGDRGASHKGLVRNKEYYGIANVTVHRTELIYKVYGGIDHLASLLDSPGCRTTESTEH